MIFFTTSTLFDNEVFVIQGQGVQTNRITKEMSVCDHKERNSPLIVNIIDLLRNIYLVHTVDMNVLVILVVTLFCLFV